MQKLQLKSHLSAKEAVLRFEGQKLTEEHYTTLFSETISVEDMNGVVLAVIVKGAIPAAIAADVLPHLLTLKGDSANRSTTVRGGAQMSRVKRDGLPSMRKTVPKAVLDAHGSKGTGQLGFMDSDCRETVWTRKNPKALVGCAALLYAVDHCYKRVLPNHYKRQMAEVDRIQLGLKLGNFPFTTITVNNTNRTACHTDKGDLRCGMGVLTTHGRFSGGYFIMPRFGIAFDIQPGDLLLANVHELHGNGAMAGQRVSVVYYAREKMHLCPLKKAKAGVTR